MGGSEEILLDKPIKEKYKTLNNGTTCPIIGLGTKNITKDEHINIVYQSIIDGIRLIDTEPKSETFVGKAIQRAISEGKVKRKDLFIITKLELDEKDDPKKALESSLERLQLGYVDLYLDHWPSCINYKNPNKKKLIKACETWEKMESLVGQKKTRGIGLSNYNIENLMNVFSNCRIKPCAVEVEFHPFLYQRDLKELCDREKIVLFGYNPLGKGENCKKDYQILNDYDLFNEAPIHYLAKKYETNEKYKNEDNYHLTKGKIILNWHMCLGVVPIIGTLKQNRMKENLAAKSFTLDEKMIDLISSEQRQFRFNDGSDVFGIDIFA